MIVNIIQNLPLHKKSKEILSVIVKERTKIEEMFREMANSIFKGTLFL